MYDFLKNALESNIHCFEKNKHEHTDINMLDIMYAQQEVTCLNTVLSKIMPFLLKNIFKHYQIKCPKIVIRSFVQR